MDRVGDRRPERRADKEESEWRPERVGNEAENDISEARVLCEATVGGNDHTDNSDVDEGQVETGHVVEKDDAETDEHVLALFGVTFVQSGAKGSGGLEGLRLTTQPGGEDEGAHDAKGDVGRHPELVARASLTGVVSGGNEQSQFTETVRDSRGETGPDQPAELLFSREGDEALAPQQNDGNGEQRRSEEQSVNTERGVQESGESLSESHLANGIAVETELQLGGGVDSSNSPSCTLLKVSTKVFRDGTELEGFVDVGSPPSSAKHQGGGRDILRQRAKREVADLFEGLASNDITGTSAPSDTERVLDRLNNMHEEIQTLGEGVGCRGVVKQLRRACKGHLGVHQQVGKDRTEPVLFGNLQGVSQV